MKRLLLAVVLIGALVVPAHAQDPWRTFEQITVANIAIGFTSAKIVSGAGHPQANWAVCRLETAEIRYTYDGTTPTSTVGVLLEIGDTLSLNGNQQLQNFKAIRTGSTSGQLDCTYGS